MKTYKQVIRDNKTYSKLINNVIEQLGINTNHSNYDENTFTVFEDVLQAGANAGFSGFIYYSETFDFYKANKEQILELLEDLMDSIGDKSLVDFVASFNCVNANDREDYKEIEQALYGNPKESTQITNALAWFALEEVARMFEN